MSACDLELGPSVDDCRGISSSHGCLCLLQIVTSSYTDLQDYTYYFVPAPWLSVKLLRLLQYYPPPGNSSSCHSYCLCYFNEQCSLQAAFASITLFFPDGCRFHDGSHKTSANFMMWKVEELMLVNLDGPPLKSFAPPPPPKEA